MFEVCIRNKKPIPSSWFFDSKIQSCCCSDLLVHYFQTVSLKSSFLFYLWCHYSRSHTTLTASPNPKYFIHPLWPYPAVAKGTDVGGRDCITSRLPIQIGRLLQCPIDGLVSAVTASMARNPSPESLNSMSMATRGWQSDVQTGT